MRKVRHYAKRVFWNWVYGTSYVIGLTLIYPFFIWGGTTTLSLLISSVFVLFAVVGIYRHERTVAKTIQHLGTITLVPGIVGVLLLVLGKPTLALFLPDGITPFVETYIAFAVPRAAVLTIIYFVLGVILLIVGKKLR